MPIPTTNYNFNKPLVNNATDADLWGGQLNSNWDDLDALLFGSLPDGNSISFDTGKGINDENSNEMLLFTTALTAVNYFNMGNAATGSAPYLSVAGDDANVDMAFQAKGTGAYNFLATADSASEVRLFEDTDNGSNYVGLKAPSTIGSNVTFTLPDADGTAGQALTTDGAGNLSFGGASSTVTVQTFTSSGTWTRPSGCTKIKVTVTAGGGGGGGTSGSQVGGTGGTSSFGAFASATGGGGGQGAGAGNNGGSAGSASGGTINLVGQAGTGAQGTNTTATAANQGGASFWGGAYGAGGSGHDGGSNARNGGSGGSGGTSIDYIDVTSLASETVTVGAGGVAGGSGSSAGKGGFVLVEEYY